MPLDIQLHKLKKVEN